MMQAFFKDYSKAKALPPPIFEQFESVKAHVVPTDTCRKLPMATAKAARVHARAVLWL